MNQNLEQFISQIVSATELHGKIKSELKKELLAHMLEQEKELQLQGYPEEKIFRIIQERFGDIKSISAQLYMAHQNENRYIKWLKYFLIYYAVGVMTFLIGYNVVSRCTVQNLAECSEGFFASLALTLFTPTRILVLTQRESWPFLVAFLVATTVLGGVAWGISYIPRLRQHSDSIQNKKIFVKLVLSLSTLLLFGSLLFSLRDIPYQDFQTEPIKVAGFPITAIYFPMSPLGGNYIPIKMWPAFFGNYMVWGIVSLISVGFVFRKVLRYKKYMAYFNWTALFLTIEVLAWLIFKFD